MRDTLNNKNASTTLRMRAKAQPFVLGGFVFSPDSNIPAVYAQAGFDFVVLDMEHCLNDLRVIQTHLRSCAAAGIHALVRVGAANFADVPRLLDGGTEGIVVPHLGLPGAKGGEVIASMKYAPAGTRPTCTGVPAAGFGLANFANYAKASNENVLAVGLIEDRQAVEAIDRVLDESAVDWVMPGPADLATSYGVPGELRHPEIDAAIDAVIRAAQRRKIATGVYVSEMSEIPAWIDKGVHFFVYSIDYKILARSLKSAADELRTRLA